VHFANRQGLRLHAHVFLFIIEKEKDGKKLIYWDQLPGRWNPLLISDLLEARKSGDDIVNRYWFRRYKEVCSYPIGCRINPIFSLENSFDPIFQAALNYMVFLMPILLNM
jgi:hypothetical protein